MKPILSTVLLAVVATSISCSPPPAPHGHVALQAIAPPDLAGLDSYVLHAMEEWSVPGLAMAVVRGDSVLLARGYGVRRIGSTDSVDASTMFGLLSPTKGFTAAALAMLVDEGALSWDDRVVDHLPHFRLSDAAINAELRIRHLLSNQSGYADDYRLWHGTPRSRKELVASMADLPSVAPLGDEFHYNNLMFVVAGEVIEAVSGLTWDEFVAARIFGPLGMHQTTTSAGPLASRENVASPHARRPFNRVGRVRPISYYDSDNVGPAGSIHSNVEEMARWLQLHLNDGTHNGKRLLSIASLEEIQRPHILVGGGTDAIGGDRALGPVSEVATNLGYGLGWFTLDYRGRRALFHGGGINGQRSAVGILPDDDLAVVILSNMQDTEIALALAWTVFDIVLGFEPQNWSAAYRVPN